MLNLRLPRSLVAIALGANGAFGHAAANSDPQSAGLAVPARYQQRRGMAMSLTSAFSPAPLAGYSLAFIAACGGGVSWLLVMAAGGGWRQGSIAARLILAGIALSALCMALTRVTLLLAEDRAYEFYTGWPGAFRTFAGRSSGSCCPLRR